ncbi:MAG: hypothetical protein HQ572_00290, partial [Candidatus Omnitrophica bacterium]|nr:hypothetical protein [Candidatus Omnitrophota bacterium]
NFRDNTGYLRDFEGFSEPWYTKGKEAERVSEDKFIVRKGYVTTCDHERPHWKLSANRVEVYPDVMVKAYNAVAWINPLSTRWNIPIFWIPWYCHPLDDKPQVTVIPGKNKDWGYYLLTAWRYNLTPNHKGHVNIDYREMKDLAVGIEHVYDTKGFGQGNITTYYMHERDIHDLKHNYHRYTKKRWPDSFGHEKDFAWEPTTELEKGLLRIRHQWEMAPETLLTAEMYKYKDEDFLEDYFYNEYEKDTNPRSYLLFTNTSGFCNVSVLTEKRMNRFDTVTERLPEVKVDINNLPIFEEERTDIEDDEYGAGYRLFRKGSFYYTGNFNAANFNKVYPRHTDDDPGTITDPSHSNRYDAYNKLSYMTKLGFLSVNPFVATRYTLYDRETDRDKLQFRSIFESGVELSTKFFKVFNTKASPFGMEINNLRHVITPTMNYTHRPQPSMPSSKVAQFDGIDSIGRTSSMSLGLENKLQTKRGKDLTAVDLAMLLVSTSYDFNHTPGTQFGDYTTKLELRPFDWLIATSNATFDLHKRYHRQWFRQVSNSISFRQKNKWSLGIGHNYTHESNSLSLNADLDFIPGWRFKIYEDFNILGELRTVKKKWDLREQQYVVTKSLHCWDLDIRYNVRRDEGEEIMLVFRLKGFPDIPFEFGKEYHTPKAGSQA